MEWIAWVLVAFVAMSACRGRCAREGRGQRRLSSGRGAARRGGTGSRALEGSRSSARSGGETAPRAELPPASPLDTLQRRFVEGRIDMEQYERELDRLYALDSGER